MPLGKNARVKGLTTITVLGVCNFQLMPEVPQKAGSARREFREVVRHILQRSFVDADGIRQVGVRWNGREVGAISYEICQYRFVRSLKLITYRCTRTDTARWQSQEDCSSLEGADSRKSG